jgi:uncharacterized protein YxeA
MALEKVYKETENGTTTQDRISGSILSYNLKGNERKAIFHDEKDKKQFLYLEVAFSRRTVYSTDFFDSCIITSQNIVNDSYLISMDFFC